MKRTKLNLDPTNIFHYMVYTSEQTLVTVQDSPSIRQNSQGNTLSLLNQYQASKTLL